MRLNLLSTSLPSSPSQSFHVIRQFGHSDMKVNHIVGHDFDPHWASEPSTSRRLNDHFTRFDHDQHRQPCLSWVSPLAAGEKPRLCQVVNRFSRYTPIPN